MIKSNLKINFNVYGFYKNTLALQGLRFIYAGLFSILVTTVYIDSDTHKYRNPNTCVYASRWTGTQPQNYRYL